MTAIKFTAWSFAAALALAAPAIAQNTEKQVIHGMEVSDPYRWMEETDTDQVKAWSDNQTRLTTEFVLGADMTAMKARITELSTFDLRYAARRRGDRLFYLRRPKDGGPAQLRVREAGESRLLTSSDRVPDTEYEESFIGGRNFGATLWPDRAGNMVAYGYNDGVSQAGKLRVIDSRTGLHLSEEIRDVGHGLTSLTWAADGSGFYYYRTRSVAVEDGSGTRTRLLGLYFHRLGTQQSADRAIIAQEDGDRFIYTPYVSTDGRHLIVGRTLGTADATVFLIYDTRNLDRAPAELFGEFESRFLFLGDEGSRLFFQTTYGAPNGRVVYVDLETPDRVHELVAEGDEPMLAGSTVGGDIIGYAAGHVMIGYLVDGVPEARVFDGKGRFKYRLDVAAGQTIWGGLQTVPGSKTVSISTLSALAPGEIQSFDVTTGALQSEFEPPVAVDPADFIIEHVMYTSRDGTPVPMYVARHKNTSLDGSNPAFMYAYGMHKWVSFLFYQPHIVHWMELGGVYAMPAIRGGGEYGDAWHQAGIKLNRQNARDDFVYAGKWLIENAYTSAKKLAANGSSASGPLAAIAALQHGDVFAASTVDYPVADMVRAPIYGNGALMTEEYGSLDNPIEARAIIAGSPYHLAQAPSCRVPTLVMVGAEDRLVLPFHGLKLAAAMQDGQACDQPILFRMMPDTGHNYGNDPERIAENTAIQLAFLRRVLDF